MHNLENLPAEAFAFRKSEREMFAFVVGSCHRDEREMVPLLDCLRWGSFFFLMLSCNVTLFRMTPFPVKFIYSLSDLLLNVVNVLLHLRWRTLRF